MSDYRNMSVRELWDEQEAWQRVIDQPKGPGEPSNEARETALRHLNEIDGWIARRSLENGR